MTKIKFSLIVLISSISLVIVFGFSAYRYFGNSKNEYAVKEDIDIEIINEGNKLAEESIDEEIEEEIEEEVVESDAEQLETKASDQ
ncbi:MAG: hypothetical protein COX30_01205 [Candidatus Moranbacteria bacterium CG23_combo_of_CG06-09_8_20_14_all_39_10]|nr:MAG: hypothetical protein COX30_01205 [Candidatus Moranbacteria bacterium CG23_combo_of_CG06-09_8_20_14_all_39_10]